MQHLSTSASVRVLLEGFCLAALLLMQLQMEARAFACLVGGYHVATSSITLLALSRTPAPPPASHINGALRDK